MLLNNTISLKKIDKKSIKKITQKTWVIKNFFKDSLSKRFLFKKGDSRIT